MHVKGFSNVPHLENGIVSASNDGSSFENVLEVFFYHRPCEDLEPFTKLSRSSHSFSAKLDHLIQVDTKEKIKKFIARILQDWSDRKEEFHEILQRVESYTFSNKKEMKEFTWNVQAKLIDVISPLESEEIAILAGTIKPPQSMKNIFHICSLMKSAEKLSVEQDMQGEEHLLKNIRDLKDLAGLKVAEKIEDEVLQANALKAMTESFVEELRFEEAKQVANEISLEDQKKDAFAAIAKALIKANRLQDVYQLRNEIEDLSVKQAINGEIVEFDGSALQEITDLEEREKATRRICVRLIEVGKIPEALELLEQIQDQEELVPIFVAFGKRGCKTECNIVRKRMEDNSLYLQAWIELIKAFAEDNQVERAAKGLMQLVSKVRIPHFLSDDAWKAIAEAFVKKGNSIKAREAIDKILDERVRESVLATIHAL